MCFSASASFIAGGGLIALGGASLVIAKKEDKILAAIPLLFGVQQISEGFQWLYLNKGSSSSIAAYIFLFFAYIVWPIYVPTFVYLLDAKRRKILKWFMFLGLVVAIYFLGMLLTQHITVSRLDYCINYSYYFPFKNMVLLVYLSAIFGSLLISSHRAFRWFGVVSFILAVISFLFFYLDFTSVWCFFAAIISSIFFVYIYNPELLKLK
jgi:hypothetical protein